MLSLKMFNRPIITIMNFYSAFALEFFFFELLLLLLISIVCLYTLQLLLLYTKQQNITLKLNKVLASPTLYVVRY